MWSYALNAPTTLITGHSGIRLSATLRGSVRPDDPTKEVASGQTTPLIQLYRP